MDTHILERYLELENEIFALNIGNFDLLDDCKAMLEVIDRQTRIINEMEDKYNDDVGNFGDTIDTYLAMEEIIQVTEISAESNEAPNSLYNMSSNDFLQEKLEKLANGLTAQLQAKIKQFDESDLGKELKEIQFRATCLDDTILQLEECKMDRQNRSDQLRAEDENETLRIYNEISELEKAVADQECRQNQLIEEKESRAEQCHQLDKQIQGFFGKFTDQYDSGAPMQSSMTEPVIPLFASQEKIRPVQFDPSLKRMFEKYEHKDDSNDTMNFNTEVSPMKDSQPLKISSRKSSTEGMSEVENSSKKPSGSRLVLPVIDYTMGSSQVKPTDMEDLSVLKTSTSQKSNSSRDSKTSKKSFLETVFNWPGSQELKLPMGSQEKKQMKKPELTSGSHLVPPVTDCAMGSSQTKPTETDDLPVLQTSTKPSSSQKSNSSRDSKTSKKSFLETVFNWPRSQEQNLPSGSQEEKQMKKPEMTIMQKPEIKDAVAQSSQIGNISTGQKMKISPRAELPITSEKFVKDDPQPKPKEIPESKKITIISDVTIKAKSNKPPIKSPSVTSLQESEMNFDEMEDFGNDFTSEIAVSEGGFSMGGPSAAGTDVFGDQRKSPGSGFGW